MNIEELVKGKTVAKYEEYYVDWGHGVKITFEDGSYLQLEGHDYGGQGGLTQEFFNPDGLKIAWVE